MRKLTDFKKRCPQSACATSIRITTNQEAIRALFRVVYRYVGNLADAWHFPDYPARSCATLAPIAKLTMMRWGMPSPPRTGAFRSPTSATRRRRTGAAG